MFDYVYRFTSSHDSPSSTSSAGSEALKPCSMRTLEILIVGVRYSEFPPPKKAKLFIVLCDFYLLFLLLCVICDTRALSAPNRVCVRSALRTCSRMLARGQNFRKGTKYLRLFPPLLAKILHNRILHLLRTAHERGRMGCVF